MNTNEDPLDYPAKRKSAANESLNVEPMTEAATKAFEDIASKTRRLSEDEFSKSLPPDFGSKFNTQKKEKSV